jgi:hypothetical protein
MHHTRYGSQGVDEPALLASIEAETGEAPPYAFGTSYATSSAKKRRLRKLVYVPFSTRA